MPPPSHTHTRIHFTQKASDLSVLTEETNEQKVSVPELRY